ncbi:MAG: hypothetical protein QOF93_128, partial [Verrucomicrobiota bacterium]
MPRCPQATKALSETERTSHTNPKKGERNVMANLFARKPLAKLMAESQEV